jgi:hypothetical protein
MNTPSDQNVPPELGQTPKSSTASTHAGFISLGRAASDTPPPPPPAATVSDEHFLELQFKNGNQLSYRGELDAYALTRIIDKLRLGL